MEHSVMVKKLVLLSGRCWSHQRLGAGEDEEQNTGRVGHLKDFRREKIIF